MTSPTHRLLLAPRPWPGAGRLAMLALTILLAGCSMQKAAPPAPAPQPAPGNEQIMCTMDVMQCPSGEWVGRQPPACQFVCPGAASGTPPAAPR